MHKPGHSYPPLLGGEHLTREEFEARYDATPGLKKAELIEGLVYLESAVPQVTHSGPHFGMVGWLGACDPGH